MRAYISISYKERNNLIKELDVLKDILKIYNIEPFVFTDKYSFQPDQEKIMMDQAFTDIDASELFIAEVSDKAIGIGVETGYAKAKGKTIIYLRNSKAEHSTTVFGASDYRLVYDDVDSLKSKLHVTLKTFCPSFPQMLY